MRKNSYARHLLRQPPLECESTPSEAFLAAVIPICFSLIKRVFRDALKKYDEIRRKGNVMLKKIRIFLICTLTLSIIIWIAAFIITQKYVIRGFSLLYPLYGAVFSVAFLIIEIIKKVELKRVGQVVISSLIVFGAFVGCFILSSFKEMLYGSGNYMKFPLKICQLKMESICTNIIT